MGRRSEQSRSVATIAACVAAVVAIISVAGAVHAHRRAADGVRPAASGRAISIDWQAGETFTPLNHLGGVAAPTGDPSVLTPDEAYRMFDGGSSKLPPHAVVMLGHLDLPVGPGAPGEYVVKDRLVYAYTWHQCAPVPNLPMPNPRASATETPSALESTFASMCTQWIFLDAFTGAEVDMTWS